MKKNKLQNTLKNIRLYQQKRLQETYKDLLESPIYHKVASFFFHQVYPPEGKEKRDQAFMKLLEKMVSVLGEKKVRKLTKLFELKELNEITDQFDEEVARIHLEKFGEEVKKETYEKAFQEANKKALREKQIELLLITTSFFHRLAHIPGTGMIIKITQHYAKKLGIEDLMGFFLEGYYAFRSVSKKEAEFFLKEIKRREKAYLDKLLS